MRLGGIMHFHVMNTSEQQFPLRSWRGKTIWQVSDQGVKKWDFHEDIIADGMCHRYSCWTMIDACPVIWRPSWFWDFPLFFFLINNATNVHFGGWFATVEYQLWKISFKFFTRINFLTWFHVAVPFCLPFIGPSFLLPSHLSFTDSRWGAVACWALRLDERTIRIQRCIIDHTVRSSSFCAPALFLLFLYLISKTLFVCQVFFILLCNSLLFLSMDKWAK